MDRARSRIVVGIVTDLGLGTEEFSPFSGPFVVAPLELAEL